MAAREVGEVNQIAFDVNILSLCQHFFTGCVFIEVGGDAQKGVSWVRSGIGDNHHGAFARVALITMAVDVAVHACGG